MPYIKVQKGIFVVVTYVLRRKMKHVCIYAAALFALFFNFRFYIKVRILFLRK